MGDIKKFMCDNVWDVRFYINNGWFFNRVVDFILLGIVKG